jgi:adenosylcobalamin-dependent ribonucleoside-triphosphate reductase
MTHNVEPADLVPQDNKQERLLMIAVSTRAQVITRRTYNRPTSDDGKQFETWQETVARVIDHQQWLWERAVGRDLNDVEYAELYDLEQLMLDRKVLMSGRTLWLGGTTVAKTREASQFNCSFTHVETIYDVVDCLWLLLQGCGVGFKPIVGTLNGFSKPIKNIRVVRSTRTEKGGNEANVEYWEQDTKTWTIQVGDSAEAWAKSIGKLIAGKYPADTLVLDFSQLRPAGERLKGYGWISSGDSAISTAYVAIANILNGRADSLLTRMDILDIVNHLGTILSSRRSAEIALFDYGQPEWEEFAVAKKDWWAHGNAHRTQSNNSLVFKEKPLKSDLEKIFGMMVKAGGSEPGFINEVEAIRRAPWFKGANPCVEILLGNKSFCNLTETDIAKFKGDTAGLHAAIRLAARANYRQTCVNLQDGILQESWHLNNYFLRLCGVGLTGIAMRPDMGSYDYEYLKRTATGAAIGMANELGLPAPKNVTCIKPSGTLSKIMDTTEGVHKPLGKYIFNNVQFSKHDPVVEKMRDAGYRVFNHPVDDSGVLITFPVKWDGVQFDEVDGKEVNIESAIIQLERYKLLQTSWNQQNTSVTISYDPTEVPGIIDWLLLNWDCYVGVSFIYRTDPTKTAKDLGYLYLPQEVVTEEDYTAYVKVLSEVDLNNTNSFDEILDAECATGACPIK